MAIESDIIEAIETRLDNMKSGSPYNLTWQYVETRDENIDPSSLNPSTDTPYCAIRYGQAGSQQRGFLDAIRVGMVAEMMPIDVRVVLFDSRSGDTITAKVAKAREDIRLAIGDHLRTDVTGVTDAWVGPPFRPQAAWFSDTEEFIVPITVWYKYQQRDVQDITTLTGQIIPQNIVVSVDKGAGEATITFTVPTEALGVNIFRNNSEVEVLNTSGTYTDSSWDIDVIYWLEAEYGPPTVLKPTEHLAYPYYDANEPNVIYLGEAWGETYNSRTPSPEQQIEARIRRIYEDEMDSGDIIEDIAYTVVGPLRHSHLVSANLPLLHLEPLGDVVGWTDVARDQNEAQFRATVYASADDSENSPAQSKRNIWRILDGCRQLNSQHYQWDNIGGAVNTHSQRISISPNAIEAGFIRCFTGMLEFIVTFTQNRLGV